MRRRALAVYNKLQAITNRVHSSIGLLSVVVGTLVAILGFCSPALCAGTLIGLIAGAIISYVILGFIDKLEGNDAEEEVSREETE